MKTFCENKLVGVNFLMGFLMVFGVALPGNVLSQSAASSTWSGTSNDNAVNIGNVTGSSASWGSGVSKHSNYSNGLRLTGFNNYSRTLDEYYEYEVSPNSGNDFTITSISWVQMNYYTTRNMVAYYSIDNFTTETQLGGTMSNYSSQNPVSFTGLNISVPDGSTFKIRLYYWYLYGYKQAVEDMVISGTTTAGGPSLSYSSSSYCSADSDPSPTLSGNAGAGTYSSTAGLSINSSTGVIDLSASTAGSYTVTYTDTDASTATFDVTIIAAGTYYVKPAASGGSDSNNGLTTGTAFATLQYAIDQSNSCGTTIYVAAGTYTQNNITINNKSSITIIGAGMDATIFDGSLTNRFMAISGTSNNIFISDLQIKNMDEGYVNGTYSGGGLYVNSSGTINLTSLYFNTCKCSAYGGSGGGGAIYTSASSTVNVYKCKFMGNSNAGIHGTQDGGAICNVGSMKIENSLFYNNYCEFQNPQNYDGVVVFKSAATGSIVNSTIVYHSNGKIPVYVDGTATITLLNTILYGSSGGYNLKKNGNSVTVNSINCIGYTGNVWNGSQTNCTTTTDFKFTNTASGDYSITSASPCVNYGTSSISSPVSLTAPSIDITGTARSGNPDMGCYEFFVNSWTGAVSSVWSNTGNWSAGIIPTSSDSPTIPDVTNQPEITTVVTLSGLTIDSGADITVSSNSLTISGAIDLNGTINIGDATVNADGDFDATGGTIDFTDVNGDLVLSSTVTSLGSLDDVMGTVTYDGGTQTVLADSYFNLNISTAGTKTAAGNIDVNGDLTTAATASCKLDMTSYDLTIAGDLVVGATDGLDLSDASSDLIFNGTVSQTLAHAGNTSYEIYNMTINKASGNLLLSNEIEANGILTFTSGVIDATSNDLTFTGNATVTGASDASHVIGVVNKNTSSTSQFIFPIGDGTTYSPIAITPNATSSTDWEVSYSNVAYSDLSIDASGLDHVSSIEYWNLNRISGTADAVVDIWWASADNVTDYNDLAIAHYNGTDWEMITTSPYGTNTSGYIHSQGPVTSFSPFTIGTTSNVNALPVGLVMFEGEEVNQKNKLIWQVASEKNVDHFIIEKTKDGEFFEFVGSSISEQLEFEAHDYSLMDEKVDPIINYYRLTAVDVNGVQTSYNLISIDNRLMKVEKELLKITNMWGQDIQPGYKGQVIYIYTDGSIERTFKFD